MDRHSIAAISVIGITLDLMGGMYLAYDLIGGKRGPLRTLTRGVTYGLFFGIGLGLPLGLAFGISRIGCSGPSARGLSSLASFCNRCSTG